MIVLLVLVLVLVLVLSCYDILSLFFFFFYFFPEINCPMSGEHARGSQEQVENIKDIEPIATKAYW